MYTQHTPHLGDTLDLLIKAKLRDTEYPFVNNDGNQLTRERPQDIIVFMCGGTTFEEARYIAQLNATTPGVRIVLGGNNIHNTKSFMQEISEIGEKYMNLS